MYTVLIILQYIDTKTLVKSLLAKDVQYRSTVLCTHTQINITFTIYTYFTQIAIMSKLLQ